MFQGALQRPGRPPRTRATPALDTKPSRSAGPQEPEGRGDDRRPGDGPTLNCPPRLPERRRWALESKAPSPSLLPPAAAAPQSLRPLSHGAEPGAPLATPPDPDLLDPHRPLTSCRGHLQRPPLWGPSLPARVSLSDLISGLGRRGGAATEWEELSAREDPPPPSASGPRPHLLPPQVGRGRGEAWGPNWGQGEGTGLGGEVLVWGRTCRAGLLFVRRLGAGEGLGLA